MWTVGAVAAHGAIPFALSRVGDGARPARPALAAARGVGLLAVAAGAALMAWALSTHYQAAAQGWALDSRLTPTYLLRRGPYRLSRNPMYAGEAAVWLGWALVYRRPAVWAGFAVLCAALRKITRWEERRLLVRFGANYEDYVREVPRWVPGSLKRATAQ